MKWLAMILLLICGSSALARDDGRYAGSPLKNWFDGLKNGKSDLCCSFADGHVIEDADWDTVGNHYRVRIPLRLGDDYKPSQEMIWMDVPDEAVIKEPNRAGKTIVWPFYGAIGVTIRCFMAGSMG